MKSLVSLTAHKRTATIDAIYRQACICSMAYLYNSSLSLIRCLTFSLLLCLSSCQQQTEETVKVGVLHSLTGRLADIERPVVDAILLAIEEINAKGGVLGRRIEAVISDGQSDDSQFRTGAERLILQEQVNVIFGCWSLACRKQVKSVVEKNDHLLFYPVQSEGLEQSTNVIYTGSLPNQQLTPAVKWAVETHGKRVTIVTSDYAYARVANNIIKHQIEALGGEVVDEINLTLNRAEIDQQVARIAENNTDLLINTALSPSRPAFFNSLTGNDIQAPVLSFIRTIYDKDTIHPDQPVEHYIASSYFEALASADNQTFVNKFKAHYGSDQIINAAMVSAYQNIHLWPKTVNRMKAFDAPSIRQGIKGESLAGPEGLIRISSINNYTWKSLYIGQVKNNNSIDIVWKSSELIRPLPYPPYRSRGQWEAYLQSLYEGWDDRWYAEDLTNIPLSQLTESSEEAATNITSQPASPKK